MKHISLLLAMVAMGIVGRAQNWQKTNTGAKAEVAATQIEIQFFSPAIVRVLKWPAGTAFNKESLSVVKTPQSTNLKTSQ